MTEKPVTAGPGKVEAAKEPALIRWWNGASAVLDLTNPKSGEWFEARLRQLSDTYGVDGYKFDAGDATFYTGGILSFKPALSNDHTSLWGQVGLKYPLNEFRATWKMAGLPLAQRLRDKSHSWSDLRELIPGILAQGLMGYAFTCPDMIGGGEFESFLNAAVVDQELVVLSAQVSALMPMMQFSVAPWRVLDEPHLKAILKAVKVRQEHKDYILDLARKSASTGEPVVRSMEYVFPHQGYERVNDQFLLGDRFLVAPVLEQDTRRREVIFPEGKWKGFEGNWYVGPARLSLAVPADELCYFEKVK
jgi:alpha-glucosidase (family GH31 glycosyl hydrolase)